jgi:hypothetical protein
VARKYRAATRSSAVSPVCTVEYSIVGTETTVRKARTTCGLEDLDKRATVSFGALSEDIESQQPATH